MQKKIPRRDKELAVDALKEAYRYMLRAHMWLFSEDYRTTPQWNRSLKICDAIRDLKQTLEIELDKPD